MRIKPDSGAVFLAAAIALSTAVLLSGCTSCTETQIIYDGFPNHTLPDDYVEPTESTDAITVKKKVYYDHIDISGFGDFNEEWIKRSLLGVQITDDTEVEFVRWVDEDHTGLQIGIAYKELPEDRWFRHKEDLFIFSYDMDKLFVDYSVEGPERIVYAEPTFKSHFEDVNFDGVKDLVISRGTNGMSGMEMYSAYVYIAGRYEFFEAFENMYSYTINPEDQTIECVRSSGDSENIIYTSIYKYSDGEFELIEERSE